jgi:hypothetical protein
MIFKAPWQTNHFNKGQSLFIELMSGNQACKVRGKYRGKYRWVSAWFSWSDKNKHLLKFKEIKISKDNHDKIMGINKSKEL